MEEGNDLLLNNSRLPLTFLFLCIKDSCGFFKLNGMFFDSCIIFIIQGAKLFLFYMTLSQVFEYFCDGCRHCNFQQAAYRNY